MNNVSFSAPGSIILVGEYGILYGKPALASAINLSTIINYSKRREIGFVEEGSLDKTSQFIINEARNYLKKKNLFINQKKFFFSVVSNIPDNEIFGPLDAKAIALTGCIVKEYSDKVFTKEEIHNLAYQIIKKIDKKELGIHCTASTFGGLVYYRKEFEFLKNISFLNMKIPKIIEDNLFLIDTGKADESNEELENFVGKLYNTNTKKTESIFQDIEKTTKRFLISIIKEDKDFFKRCIKEHGQLLEDLGVVSRSTQRIVRDIEEFGGAKIIGSGGRRNKSGFLLCYCENEQRLKEIIDKYMLVCFPFKQSIRGLEEKTTIIGEESEVARLRLKS